MRIGAVVHHVLVFLVLLVLVLLAILMVDSSSSSTATASASPSLQQREEEEEEEEQVLLFLNRGFKATPNPRISSSFQYLLVDSTGNYSFGFLRVNKTLLSLAILHLPSSVTLWQAKLTRFPTWSTLTHLFFNGSLVLSSSSSESDNDDVVYWSTYTDQGGSGGGYRVFLSNTSNLQITSYSNHVLLWSSFDYPTDTLVENQNLTSDMFLLSSNGLYSLRLGSDFMGLYWTNLIYWRHKALQAKAQIIPGQGPIYAVLKSDGFLGMYQLQLQLLINNRSNSYSSASSPVPVPVDVQSFNSYQQPVSGVRRLRLETDGNLRGYFWTGSTWILDYEAILPDDACDLPNSCGSYGLCNPGAKHRCSCLDNQTPNSNNHHSSCVQVEVERNHQQQQKYGDDFCSPFSSNNKHRTLRRAGVELPYKELMSYKKMTSLQQCEGECEHNCTCWGAVYSNTSGFCYMLLLDYPIGTLVSVGDETKVGYFKLRERVSASNGNMKMNAAAAAAVAAFLVLVFGGVLGFWWYRNRNRNGRRRRGVMSGYVQDDNAGVGVVGPYKDLGAASFRSIELSER